MTSVIPGDTKLAFLHLHMYNTQIMKYIIALLLLVIAFLGWNRFVGEPNTQTVLDEETSSVIEAAFTQSTTTPTYQINVDIAATGVEKIDVTNALTAEYAVAQTITTSAQDESAAVNAPYSLQMDTKKTVATVAGLESQILTTYSYSGGAHGMTTFQTWTYSPETGRVYELGQIIDQNTESAAFVFEQVQATAAAHKSGLFDDATWLAEGSGTAWDNYQDFYVTETGVTFIFEQYQVASYAAGTLEVSIAWADLEPYLRGGFKSRLGFSDPVATTTASTSATTSEI